VAARGTLVGRPQAEAGGAAGDDPDEILLKAFLDPLGVSQYHLARDVRVPAWRINEIVHGQRRIRADTALRLAAISVLQSGSG